MTSIDFNTFNSIKDVFFGLGLFVFVLVEGVFWGVEARIFWTFAISSVKIHIVMLLDVNLLD